MWRYIFPLKSGASEVTAENKGHIIIVIMKHWLSEFMNLMKPIDAVCILLPAVLATALAATSLVYQ